MNTKASHSTQPGPGLAAALLLMAAWLAGCSFEPTTLGLCTDNADCQGNQVCDLARKLCVARCDQHAECTAPDAPICDIRCRPCERDEECMARDPDRGRCNLSMGTCEEPGQSCEEPSDCPADRPGCSGMRCVSCIPDETGDAICAVRPGEGDICIDAGTCSECRDDGHCTADAGKPICDTGAGTCRACRANSECESNVCDKVSGECAATADVLYVDGATGSDGNACDRAAPCKTIGNALELVEPDAHRYIRIEQGVYPQVLSISGKDVSLVGDGATIQPAVTGEDDRPVITVGVDTTVTIQGLQIKTARGNSDANGVQCTSSTSKVTIIESIVTDNGNFGVDIIQCSLVIERSTISQNQRGGIVITNAGFSITHSFVVENGDAARSQIGGLKVENFGDFSPQVISFNTIASNQAVDIADASGVRCSADFPVTASNNIVYGGFGGQAPISGLCAWTYSNIEGGAEGIGNIDADPQFVDTARRDYHITPGSPCEDAADPDADIAVDFDGDVRPQGGRSDMGADELAGQASATPAPPDGQP